MPHPPAGGMIVFLSLDQSQELDIVAESPYSIPIFAVRGTDRILPSRRFLERRLLPGYLG